MIRRGVATTKKEALEIIQKFIEQKTGFDVEIYESEGISEDDTKITYVIRCKRWGE